MKTWKKISLAGLASVGLVVGATGNQHCWKYIPYTNYLGKLDVNGDGVDDLVVSVQSWYTSYDDIGWVNGKKLAGYSNEKQSGFFLNSNINYFGRMIRDNRTPEFPADIGRRDGFAGEGIYIRLKGKEQEDFFLGR